MVDATVELALYINVAIDLVIQVPGKETIISCPSLEVKEIESLSPVSICNQSRSPMHAWKPSE